jgi:epoxyqueuosine reductase QueG
MNKELKDAVLEKCREMEIPLVGIANVERWKDPPLHPWMPEEFYPQSIFPGARSVIVILGCQLPCLCWRVHPQYIIVSSIIL